MSPTSPCSRNRTLGEKLGQGKSLGKALDEMTMVPRAPAPRGCLPIPRIEMDGMPHSKFPMRPIGRRYLQRNLSEKWSSHCSSFDSHLFPIGKNTEFQVGFLVGLSSVKNDQYKQKSSQSQIPR